MRNGEQEREWRDANEKIKQVTSDKRQKELKVRRGLRKANELQSGTGVNTKRSRRRRERD